MHVIQNKVCAGKTISWDKSTFWYSSICFIINIYWIHNNFCANVHFDFSRDLFVLMNFLVGYSLLLFSIESHSIWFFFFDQICCENQFSHSDSKLFAAFCHCAASDQWKAIENNERTSIDAADFWILLYVENYLSSSHWNKKHIEPFRL